MSDSCSLYLVSDGSLWVEMHVYMDILTKGKNKRIVKL